MAVAYDADGADFGTGTSYSGTPITVGSGSNRALLVFIVVSYSPGLAPTSASVTWNGTAMTAIGTALNDTGANNWVQAYGLVNPASGANTLAITVSGGSPITITPMAISVTGADQTGGTTTFANKTSTTGSSTTASVTVTSATNNMVVAAFGCGLGSGAITGTNQTGNANWNVGGSTGGNRAAGAASVTMTGTLSSSQPWDAMGLSIVASAAVVTPPPPDGAFSVKPRNSRQAPESWTSPTFPAAAPSVFNSFDVAPRRAARLDQWATAINPPVIVTTTPEPDPPFAIQNARKRQQVDWGQVETPPAPAVMTTIDPPWGIKIARNPQPNDWNQNPPFPPILIFSQPAPDAPFAIKPRPVRAVPDWNSVPFIASVVVAFTPPPDSPFFIAKNVSRVQINWGDAPTPTPFVGPPDAPFSIRPRRWQSSVDVSWTQFSQSATPLIIPGTAPLPWFDVKPRTITAGAKFGSWWNYHGTGNPVPVVVSTDIHGMPFFATPGQLKSW